MGATHGKDRPFKFLDSHSLSSKSSISQNTNDDETADRAFIVVWCDATIGASSNDDVNTLIQLARIVNRKRQLIHTFSELNACKEFITHANNICLIVSGQMGTDLIPLVHNLKQIHSIYIFCFNKAKYDPLVKQYEKVRGSYTEISEICDYLKKYFISQSTTSDYEQLQLDVLKSNLTLPTVDQQEVAFLYPILSKMILCNMNLIKKDDMINYCRTEYTSDYHKQLIDEFEKTYSQHDPIWWFTRDNFFQKIINRALQIHDYFTLCMMSPFIQDLIKQLAQLHGQQINSSMKTFDLHSCQSISTEDFEKIKFNQGGYMCINQFLFANSERAIPMLFLQHQTTSSINTKNLDILFRISISETNQANVSYANIGVKCQFVHEKEYLLSMSSIFRIEKVEPLVEIPSAWFVHLILVDKNDAEITKLTKSINIDQLIEKNNLTELGSTVTNKLYQFKSTRKLFEQVLNFKTKQIRSSLLHYNMGVIYDCLSEYEKAVNSYKYAIDLTRQNLVNGFQKDDLCLVPLYSNMGLSYQRLNRFTHAFDHAFRALNILSKDQDSSFFKKELFASTYFNLGLIHDLEKKSSEAKTYYDQALRSRCEYLTKDHPDVISLQNTLQSLASQ
ncbi:unnamed protein product [Adineta steineri]|uniref:Uncharacterized protein n=1 Tax=Adineta steineri TaxID=433720 RepID=A0A818Y0W9_9BILA|nr:unnamed protein product [Adineta steineri]CAF3747956.1 unnamed protein product [Adineta steineri]